MLQNFKISLELNFIQHQGLEQNFSKIQGCWCKVMRFFMEFGFIFGFIFVWRGQGAGIVDCDRRSVHGGPTTARTRSPWMLGEEEGLSETSLTVARGGGVTDAIRQRGVVAAVI
jgi:hypothetical protein